TFSNSKRTEADWDVQRDHGRLIDLILRRLSPGGVLYFSTNFRKFRMDEIDADVREISARTVPEDFRNRRIHRCFQIRHRTQAPIIASPDPHEAS
ncbi:MAG: hypothetical protein KDA28_14445, partial [Phycisphaerales bacterium]|nr:hypothetical protein [Phycisphaerales bacterium]